MSHGEAELGALAILQSEHVVAHAVPAAGLLPNLSGVEGGEVELLTDPVHLLPDDVHDLQHGAIAEKEIRIDSGGKLANVPRPQ